MKHTKHVKGQIAKKIRGEVPLDLLETIFAAAHVRKFDDRVDFTETLQGATFRATVLISGRSPSNNIYELCSNINTVTMLMGDI